MGRLLAKFKEWLARRMLLVEFCHRCGRRVRNVWHVSDELWAKVHGPGQSPWCLSCFDREADDKGMILYWTAQMRTFPGEIVDGSQS